jgi:arylsulfatase A-like enzyme
VQPNLLVLLIDDQGWDDIGLHNPMVQTPNLDAFIAQSTLFDNFYVTPQCAQTRAALLTGRSHPRTGVMLVHGGASPHTRLCLMYLVMLGVLNSHACR